MAWYPYAIRRPLGRRGVRMARPVRINLHTAVFNGPTLASIFADGPFSHFYVRKNGDVEQYQDTALTAAADLDGNDDTISIESWDGWRAGAPGFWRDNGDIPPWTPAQTAEITRLVRWLLDTHPTIPGKIATNNRAGLSSQGVGWHRLGVVPFAAYPRSVGGLLYSKSRGKTCPGDRRIAQVPAIVAAATTKPKPPAPTPPAPTREETEDMALITVKNPKTGEAWPIGKALWSVWFYALEAVRVSVETRALVAETRALVRELANRQSLPAAAIMSAAIESLPPEADEPEPSDG